MPWTRAIDLQNWAAELESRGLLPSLVRRLIAHTADGLSKLNIPAQEQVGRPGFDGSVEVVQGNRFVPPGLSVWEMGVDQKPEVKANRDFATRLTAASADTTFVFVTPRNWLKKDEWAAKKAAASGWKSVVAYDANDLEHWLEMAHGVDAWISTHTRRLPSGLQSLDTHWRGVSAIAAHPLVPQVFISSRDSEVAQILRWLSGQPDSLFLRTASLNDGIDFLSALAAGEKQKLLGDTPFVPSPEQLLLQDAIVVHTAEEWRQLATTRGALLLAVLPTLNLSAADVSTAVEAGHHVFVSGPRGIVPTERAVELRGLAAFELERSLQASGFSEAEAAKFTRGSCGSSTILKRLVTRHPETIFPAWSLGDEVTRLAPYALIGGWRHVNATARPKEPDGHPTFQSTPPIDVDVVTTLVGCDRSELDESVARWTTSEEPLFTRFGDRVLVISREDSWHLLGHAVTDQQLQRFVDFAGLMLDEDNPAFELKEDKRWMAAIYGKSHTISTELRRSLVESLALMAVYPTLGGFKRDTQYAATVRKVVEQALPADAGWQRWASLDENLQTIAEAAPELFLQRVEEDLKSETPALPQLFTEGMGGFTGGKLNCNLLWALEVLAWSPQYLARSAVVLADLVSRIPPKDNYANRPENSLREVFLLWLWHTNATTEQRLGALQSVLNVVPDAGWNLLKELLPSGHMGVSHNTAMPRWRDWADGWSRESIQPHRREYTLAVAKLATQEAGASPSRWADIIEGMLRISDETTKATIAALEKLVEAFKDDTDSAFALWSTLRAMIARNEGYQVADWTFDRDILARLSRIRDAIAPSDPVLKYGWLFQPRAELYEPKRAADYEAHEEALYNARRDALRKIIEAKGPPGVFQLLELDADANAVGWILAKDKLLGWEAIALPEFLTSDDTSRRRLAWSFVSSAFVREEWDFISALPAASWTPPQASTLAKALPCRRDVWDWVATLGADVEDEYWRGINQYLRDVSLEDLQFATDSLIRRGRAFHALRVLRSSLRKDLKIPSETIGHVLESAVQPPASGDAQQASDLSYEIQQLIKALQQDEMFDRSRLALIEWGYLPVLDRSYSEVGPDTLTSAIAEEPQLFATMIAAIYRSEKDPPDVHASSEQEQVRARRAYEFLEGLERLPGILEAGILNVTALATWIAEVRRCAKESGHTGVCETILGNLLARAVKDRLDDPWFASEVAPFLEQIGTEELLRGIVTGLINSRGVTMRGPFDGGMQEHELAFRFRESAKKIRAASGRLADAFESLAEHYDVDANREDQEAARLRLGR